MYKYNLLERKMDKEGRILIPRQWRKRYGRKIIILEKGEELHIIPKKSKSLSDLPELSCDLKSKLTDWHKVKTELINIK